MHHLWGVHKRYGSIYKRGCITPSGNQLTHLRGIRPERCMALQEGEPGADELEVTFNAATKRQAGRRSPGNQKSILHHLDRLLHQGRVPPQRRYQKGARSRRSLESLPAGT